MLDRKCLTWKKIVILFSDKLKKIWKSDLPKFNHKINASPNKILKRRWHNIMHKSYSSKVRWHEPNTDSNTYQLWAREQITKLPVCLSKVTTIQQNIQDNQNEECHRFYCGKSTLRNAFTFKDICIKVLIMLFIIEKTSKQVKFLLEPLLKKLKDHSYYDILCSHYKEWDSIMCIHMKIAHLTSLSENKKACYVPSGTLWSHLLK